MSFERAIDELSNCLSDHPRNRSVFRQRDLAKRPIVLLFQTHGQSCCLSWTLVHFAPHGFSYELTQSSIRLQRTDAHITSLDPRRPDRTNAAQDRDQTATGVGRASPQHGLADAWTAEAATTRSGEEIEILRVGDRCATLLQRSTRPWPRRAQRARRTASLSCEWWLRARRCRSLTSSSSPRRRDLPCPPSTPPRLRQPVEPSAHEDAATTPLTFQIASSFRDRISRSKFPQRRGG